MRMACAHILRLVPNETYIPLTHVGGFAQGDMKNLRHLRQRYQHVGIFALDDTEVPNANSFASQWNIGISQTEGGRKIFPCN